MDPIKMLRNKLNRENIIVAQAEEFAEIIEECKNSPKFLAEKLSKKNETLTLTIQNDFLLIQMEKKTHWTSLGMFTSYWTYGCIQNDRKSWAEKKYFGYLSNT